DNTALLVIDVQERLIPHITDHKRIVWNIRRLIDAATILGVRVVGTEQYPKGLGPTVPVLAERLGTLPEKLMFSCRECWNLFNELKAQGMRNLLVTGIETHVCVQQTVLDFLAQGWGVYVAADAVGSRHRIDYEIALRRMEVSGAVLTTTEAALFEWCVRAGTDQFKKISRLVQESLPDE
ncbi:MAG TPA: hydrolase, partial [Thermogutta sp.]|nr:hydrolase [Thermogutta sp.]